MMGLCGRAGTMGISSHVHGPTHVAQCFEPVCSPVPFLAGEPILSGKVSGRHRADTISRWIAHAVAHSGVKASVRSVKGNRTGSWTRPVTIGSYWRYNALPAASAARSVG